MKKTIRRTLAATMVVLMVMSMVVMISAASTTVSTTFKNGDRTYYAELTKESDRNDYYRKIDGGVQAYHVSGGVDTPIYGGHVGYDMTYTAAIPSGFYATYLRSLLGQVGLQESCTKTGNTGSNWVYVDPGMPTGTYQWAIRFNAHDADWEVGSSMQGIYFGTISKAPTGQAYYGVIRVA